MVESMINTTLSRPANAPLEHVPDVEYTAPHWTFEQLHQLALENRPELKGMNFTIDMNKAELSGSKREYYPDIMARVTYKNMSDTKNDFWAAMVGINIPLAFSMTFAGFQSFFCIQNYFHCCELQLIIELYL